MSFSEALVWRAWRLWPAVGCGVAVAVFAAAVGPTGWAGALLLSVAVWTLPMIGIRIRAAHLLGETRDAWACHDVADDAGHDRRFHAVEKIGERMVQSAAQLKAGEISAAHFRAEWSTAYADIRPFMEGSTVDSADQPWIG
jgi:hypothetical protein